MCRANRLDSLQIHLKPWVYISKLLSLQVGRCVYVGVCVCVNSVTKSVTKLVRLGAKHTAVYCSFE